MKIFLLLYFIFYIGIIFTARTLIIGKKIGKSPIVLQKDDGVHGLVGKYIKFIMAALLVYVFVYALFPEWYKYCLPIIQFEHYIIRYTGLAFLIFSFFWTFTAQNNMRTSWRIGIDGQSKTELISGGLFRITRNPVFLGMIISLLGLFLFTPNGFTGIILIFGFILIQIQVRLEEEYLLNIHGEIYREYCRKVKRWF